ncbi:hypothetical protein ACJ73_00576 [Blastomyces percursus]|uniref:Uncharacterized protein n=1 Tax=Blastomyces percursus TaxID=1658174 RepID=A0A1J9RK92_9EURO|nr:hypothetical protein ACJ73_00576 [Blastomyces percursus]
MTSRSEPLGRRALEAEFQVKMPSFKVKSEQGKLVVRRCEEGDPKQEQTVQLQKAEGRRGGRPSTRL